MQLPPGSRSDSRLNIRPETVQDRPAILDLLGRAFADQQNAGREPVEVELARKLFGCPEYLPALSLVAEKDGRIVGHVISTRGWIGDRPSLGLGPIAVLPEEQGQGIGAALMHETIRVARELGERSIVLLGHLDYYPRFGFVPAAPLGIQAPDPAWGDHFMALVLAGNDRGPFRYAGPFSTL